MPGYEKQNKKAVRNGQNGQNRTGIPDQVKQKLESTSGLSLDDVRIHYRSSRPARLNALAYTQGNNVYLETGQERYLPHELGHVIQQKQMTIRPTATINGFAVNTSPVLEQEADRYAAGQMPVLEKQESRGAGVPQLMCKDGRNGKWSDFVKKMEPEEKVIVRQANSIWSENSDVMVLMDSSVLTLDETVSEINDPVLCILEAGEDTPPKSITEFYEEVTEYMKDSLYWINYATFATGDLTSLSAFIINDKKHGIAMQWQQIGNKDRDSNMKMLAQYLGGIVDSEKKESYVITKAGAKGKWLFGEGRDVEFDSLSDDRKLEVNLQEAAIIHLQTAKQWNVLRRKLENAISIQSRLHVSGVTGTKTISSLVQLKDYAQEAAVHHSRAMRKAALGRNTESAKLAAQENHNAALDNVVLLLNAWIIIIRSAPGLSKKPPQKYMVAEKKGNELERFSGETCYTIEGLDFSKPEDIGKAAQQLWQEAGMSRDAVWSTSYVVDELLKLLSGDRWDDKTDENDIKPGVRMVRRKKFVEGTLAVATSWDSAKRRRVRKAWGVGNSEKEEYDTDIEIWLQNVHKINPATAIQGKEVVVLWIRKSGERGGAHFENDTSFRLLSRRIQQYSDATVILTGDDKRDGAGGSKTDRLAAPEQGVYNLTQFWADGSMELKAWGGNTRTGQFRLFDYLNRKAADLKHVGAMSGNLEAMALLGHKTEVHVGTPEDAGVSRMTAYPVHDMGVERDEDKLQYDFAFNRENLGIQTPYEKKAAVYYVELKKRLSYIYDSIVKEFIYNIGISPDIRERIRLNTCKRESLQKQLESITSIRHNAESDSKNLERKIRQREISKQEVQRERKLIQERTQGLETKESIEMKISELTPHVEETVMSKGNHPSPFDSSSEGMGSLWTLPVDVRMVIIDGIVRQKIFDSVWSELKAMKLCKVNDFNTIEQIYNKMNITVWKTIWRVAGVYERLITVQPKNEDRVDKQKEQLMDFIFIQAARILSKRSK